MTLIAFYAGMPVFYTWVIIKFLLVTLTGGERADSTDRAFIIVIGWPLILGLVAVVSFASRDILYLSKQASVETITETRGISSCTDNTMKLRMKQIYDRPNPAERIVTNRDVEKLISDCKEYYAEKYRKQEQLSAGGINP